MAKESERVLTMSGAGEVPVQSLVKARITATGVKLSKRRGPRHCTKVDVQGSGKCRCIEWKPGRGSKENKVPELCKRQGLPGMGLKKLR